MWEGLSGWMGFWMSGGIRAGRKREGLGGWKVLSGNLDKCV